MDRTGLVDNRDKMDKIKSIVADIDYLLETKHQITYSETVTFSNFRYNFEHVIRNRDLKTKIINELKDDIEERIEHLKDQLYEIS